MARSFPLAGLLRLRQVQQDQAAIDLSAANARVVEGTARQRRARSSLGATSSEATSASVLYAVAASRAASRSMLAELQALDCDHRASLQDANTAFTAARAPGSITPITGTMVWLAISLSATALEVLHATTSSLMPLANRNSVFSRE